MTQTTITIGTRVHRLAHTTLRGPQGPSSVTPIAVQTALSADQAAGRAALALGTAATTDASDYDPAGAASAAITAHESASDPHPQYTTASEAAAAAPVQSVAGRAGDVTLTTADISGLGTAATANTADFATAAQGATADTALQPADGLAALDSAAATKLGGIATGATANATDAQLRDRATHTGTQSYTTITGLGDSATRNVGATAGTVAAGDDARLSDAREWTADTVTQVEAEEGTGTARKAWSVQRVWQAIAAWWAGYSSAIGRALVTAADKATARGAIDALATTGGTMTGPLAIHGNGVTSPVTVNDPSDATQILGPRIYSMGELVAKMEGYTGIFNIVDMVKNHAFKVRGQLQLVGVAGTPVFELINVAFSGNPNWGQRAFNVASPVASAGTPYGEIISSRTRMYSWDGSVKVTDILQSTVSLSATVGDVLMRTYSSTSNGNLIEQHATTGNMKIKGTFRALASTVAALPLAPPEGATAYATNGRKSGEGAGAGTGVPVYYSAGKWRVYRDDSEVQA